MNEIETLKLLKKANRDNDMVGILPKSDIGKCLIKALEEVQQYRAIGTPEELITAMKYVRLAKAHRTVGRAIEECAKYEEIGTPEECRAAVEKQKPKAVVEKSMLSHIGTKIGRCPVCLELPLRECDNQYCPGCGQKLEWEAEEVLNRIKIKSLAGLGMTAEEAAMALNTGTRKMFDLYKREKQSKL